MEENEQSRPQDQDDRTDQAAAGGEEPKSDVAREIENDPASNPDEPHLKDLKGA